MCSEDVIWGDLGNPFSIHLVAAQLSMERKRRQQRSLSRSVITLHVSRRIGLGIPLSFRLGKGFIEPGTRSRHLVKDVVGRAIDDAHNTSDLISDKRLAQRADDRNCPGYRSFVVQIDAVALGHSV